MPSCGRISTVLTAVTLAFMATARAAPAAPNGPLIVGNSSHVVVMEYEAWFGPHAVTFPPASLSPRPLLSSADMRRVGGGYDSEDPTVIQTHVGLLESMGIDAVTLDLTNNVSCIFDTGPDSTNPALLNPCGQSTADRNHGFQLAMQQIAANDANLYAAWTGLGTPLKIIPMLACQDNGCLTPYEAKGKPRGFGVDPCPAIPGIPVGSLDGNPSITGTTSFEKELTFFGDLMQQYPNLNVVYHGKPLVLVFVPPGILGDTCVMRGLQRLIAANGFGKQFTFRMLSGYFDTDSIFWNEPSGYQPTGPIPLKRGYGAIWWSGGDRLNQQFGHYPSYNPTDEGRRVENLAVSISTPGEDGWGTWPKHCKAAPPVDPPLDTCPKGTDYYVDTSLRNEGGVPYSTLTNFMTYADQLDPIFLIVDQFNEFQLPDEGWDANTTDDIEPADDGIGSGAVNAVQQAIEQYRGSRSSLLRLRF
jgi:hypothetical protein